MGAFNRTCSDAFIHGPVRLGGLGLSAFVSQVPAILFRRLNRLAIEADPTTIAILATPEVEKLMEKLGRWTVKHGGTSRDQIRRTWGERLEASYSGHGLMQGSDFAHSGSWIDELPSYWSGGDFVKAVQLRGNLLPTREIPSNPAPYRRCRAECDRMESLSHVLQGCPASHWPRIRRHDRVYGRLRQLPERKGWRVQVEPHLRLSSGLLRKLDLVLVKDVMWLFPGKACDC